MDEFKMIFTRIEDGPTVISRKAPWANAAALEVVFRSGSASESVAEFGAAHLLEHILVRADSETARMRNDWFDRLAADIRAYTFKEHVYLSALVPATAAAGALDSLLSAVDEARVTDEVFEFERAAVDAELSALEGEDVAQSHLGATRPGGLSQSPKSPSCRVFEELFDSRSGIATVAIGRGAPHASDSHSTAGSLVAYARTPMDLVEKVTGVIEETLDGIAHGDFMQEDLDRAKYYLKAGALRSRDDHRRVARSLLLGEIVSAPSSLSDEALSTLQATTFENVVDAAQRLLGSKRAIARAIPVSPR